MEMIKLLEKNSMQSIYIDAYETPFTFTKQFYTNIYADILAIQQTLENIPMLDNSSQLTESDIEKASKKLGEDYLLINFIKKIGNKIKMTRCTKYTNTNKLKPNFNNSSKSFFDIAVSNYKINSDTKTFKKGGDYKTTPYKSSTRLISKPILAKPKNVLSQKKITQTFINIPEVINSEVFEGSDYYTDKIMFDYYEDIPVPKEDNPNDQLINFITQEKSVDLNEMLYNQVSKIVSVNNYSQFMDSIYSMVLYYAYYNDGIPLDYIEHENSKSYLELIIEKIIQEDLDLSDIMIDSTSDMVIDENVSDITSTSSSQPISLSQPYPTNSNSSFSNYFWQSIPNSYQSVLSGIGGVKNKTKRSNHRRKKTKQKKTTTHKKKFRKMIKVG